MMKNCFTFKLAIWLLIPLTAVIGLSACTATKSTSEPSHKEETVDGPPPLGLVDESKILDAVPKPEPKSHYGNPSSYVAAGKRYFVLNSAKGYNKRGMASWYGTKFHGRATSTREKYNMLAMTAASPNLPLPTYARVTNLENGRQVIVKINDRGPFAANRIIDLSYAAAKKLGYAEKGLALVQVTAVDAAEQIASKAIKSNQKIKSFRSSRIQLAKNATVNHSTTLAENTKKTNKKHLYLQVGAFRQMAKAEQIKVRVSHLTHHSTRILVVSMNEKKIYRVQIGPLADTQASHLLYRQLQNQGFNNTIAIIG